MPNVLMPVKSRCLLLAVVILPVAVATVPAQAQGIFGFFRLFSQPSAPAAVYPPAEYRQPAVSQPKPKLIRVKPASAEQAAVKMPAKPKAPGEIENPFPALLTDSTLQPGDMVMFPDGLRVFMGKPGGKHRLADFQPLSRAEKSLSRSTRRLVANMHPAVNTAWSTAGVSSQGKLAANTKDVVTTGSIRGAKR